MASSIAAISEELGEIDGQIVDISRALSNGFQKFEKIKDASRQSRQLEELTGKMRECKRLIKEFDGEVKEIEHTVDPNTNKMLNEKKQSMVKELNSYVALKKHVIDFSKTKLCERTRSCYDKLYADFCAKKKSNARGENHAEATGSREGLKESDVKPIILVDKCDNEDDNGVLIDHKMI